MLCIMFGIVKHYKNKYYLVIGVGKDTETQEEKVVYYSLYWPLNLWIRDKKMFEEDVEIDGELVPRFKKVLVIEF